MADPRNLPDDPYFSGGDRAPFDSELQIDPELPEGPASGGRIAAFAVAIALVLGAVFYGLNTSSMNPAGTGSTASQTTPSQINQDSALNTVPPVQPGVRDVTPRHNMEPGTTGAAPARPVQPPASAPSGTEIDRSANPNTDSQTR